MSFVSKNLVIVTYLAYSVMFFGIIALLIAFLRSPYLYISLGLKYVGELKRKSLFIGIGLFLTNIGLLGTGVSWISGVFFIPHLMMTFGTVFLLTGFRNMS